MLRRTLLGGAIAAAALAAGPHAQAAGAPCVGGPTSGPPVQACVDGATCHVYGQVGESFQFCVPR